MNINAVKVFQGISLCEELQDLPRWRAFCPRFSAEAAFEDPSLFSEQLGQFLSQDWGWSSDGKWQYISRTEVLGYSCTITYLHEKKMQGL